MCVDLDAVFVGDITAVRIVVYSAKCRGGIGDAGGGSCLAALRSGVINVWRCRCGGRRIAAGNIFIGTDVPEAGPGLVVDVVGEGTGEVDPSINRVGGSLQVEVGGGSQVVYELIRRKLILIGDGLRGGVGGHVVVLCSVRHIEVDEVTHR